MKTNMKKMGLVIGLCLIVLVLIICLVFWFTNERVIKKTINIENPNIHAINLYSDDKIAVKEPYFSQYEKNIKVIIEGKKCLVDKVNASNINLAVDMSKYKEETLVEDTIIVKNKIDGVKYEVVNPKIVVDVRIKKILTSTVGNINLNDKLLVEKGYCDSTHLGSIMYVTTNFREIFKDYIASDGDLIITVPFENSDKKEELHQGYVYTDTFDKLSTKLIIDRNKLAEIASKFENIKQNNYYNMRNFDYKIDENTGIVSYEYNYLFMFDAPELRGDSCNPSEFDFLNDESVFRIRIQTGDTFTGDGIELNESLCSEYNLTCSRW